MSGFWLGLSVGVLLGGAWCLLAGYGCYRLMLRYGFAAWAEPEPAPGDGAISDGAISDIISTAEIARGGGTCRNVESRVVELIGVAEAEAVASR